MIVLMVVVLDFSVVRVGAVDAFGVVVASCVVNRAVYDVLVVVDVVNVTRVVFL